MSQNTRRTVRNIAIGASTVGLVYGLVFRLPYLLPPYKRVASDSYVFGSNNTVAAAGVIVAIVVLAALALGWLKCHGRYTLPWLPLFAEQTTHSGSLSKSVVIFFVLLYTVAALGLILLVRGLYYGEAAYFVQRIQLMTMGLRPYRDFECIYGPALLYVPWLLHTAFARLGLSVEGSYYLAYGLISPLGLILLAHTVDSLAISKRHRNRIFANVAIAYFPVLALGLQFTFVRYLLPYASLIVLHRTLASEQAPSSGAQARLVVLALPAATALVNLASSPELGLVYFAALSAYLLYALITVPSGRRMLVQGWGFAALSVTATIAACREYFIGMLSFGAGGANFPVVAAPYLLLWLAGLLLTVPPLLAVVIRDRTFQNALPLGFVALVAMMVPGALGRCDFGHVLWYGIGVFLALPAILAKLNGRLFRVYTWAFLLLIGMLQVVHFSLIGRQQLAEPLMRAIVTSGGGSQESALRVAAYIGLDPGESEAILRRLSRPAGDFVQLDSYPAIMTPLGADPALFAYLCAKGKFVPEYYPNGVEDIFSEDQVARKIRDLDKAPYLLLPGQPCEQGEISDSDYADLIQGRAAVLQVYFLYPGSLRPQREFYNPYSELVSFVCANYRRVASVGDYVLMTKR